MYSVIDKYYWIKDHIWSYSPVWFRYDGDCYGIYSITEVTLKNARIFWSLDGEPIDITYLILTAFESKESTETVQYGYEPIETIYQEARRCMESE